MSLRPDIQFKAFGRFSWSDIEPIVSHAPLQNAVLERVANLSAVKRNPLVRSAYRVVRELIYGARQGDVDFFHAFVYRPPVLTRAPFLPVIYDLSHKRFPEFHPSERVRWMDALDAYIDRVPMIQTISEFSKSEIVSYYGIMPEKISVIYPGLNPFFLDSETSYVEASAFLASHGINTHEFALSVATLEPRKNLKILLEAYRVLPAAIRRNFPLVVVGDKGWGAPFENAIVKQLTNEGSLRFLGYQPDAVLKVLYTHCSVFCYPSLYEGFGMPVAEAIALSAPVIASDLDVFKEISTHDIDFVAPDAAEQWALALQEAFEKRRKVISPDPASRDQFTWEESAIRVTHLYRAVEMILNSKRN